MACNVPRQVGATYKGLWTKARKNAEARRLGYTKRRFKGLDQAPHYVSPTLTYNLGRDYSLRTGQEVSLLTLAGRIHVPYQGWTRHVALLQAGATLGGAKLWYDRSKQRFYLLVSLTIATPDPHPSTSAPGAWGGCGAALSGHRGHAGQSAPSSIRERRYEPRQTITPACKNDFSEKALAAPPGAESRSASERDG